MFGPVAGAAWPGSMWYTPSGSTLPSSPILTFPLWESPDKVGPERTGLPPLLTMLCERALAVRDWALWVTERQREGETDQRALETKNASSTKIHEKYCR